MDASGKSPEDYKKLKHEVDELRSALSTVTEALVLFQEFIEEEICEMAYFRESGAFDKLATLMNNLRTQKSAKPLPNLTPIIGSQSQEYPDMGTSNSENASVSVNCTHHAFNSSALFTDGNRGINNFFSVPQLEEKLAPEVLGKKSLTVIPIHSTKIIRNLAQTEVPLKSKIFSDEHPANLCVQLPKMNDNAATASSSTFSIRPQEARTRNMSQILQSKVKLSLNKGLGKESAFVKPRFFSTIIKTKSTVSAKPVKKIGGKGLKKKREGSVKCYLCHRSYSSRGVMSRHLKEIHQIEPQFRCHYCPLRFRTGPARLGHMNAAHPEDMKSVVCPYCGRNSASPTGKRNHMLMCAKKHEGSSMRMLSSDTDYIINE